MKKDTGSLILQGIGIIAVAAVVVVIIPFISYWLAYFGGWITQLTIGAVLCDSLNSTFGTDRFTPDMLPSMAGALAWIGSYFYTASAGAGKSKNQ